MKAVIAFLIIISGVNCFGQDTTNQQLPDSLEFNHEEEGTSIYILQAGDRTLAVDAEENDKDMELLDPAWIESITIYKGADSKIKYGEKAANGVVIISLTKAGFNKLPKHFQAKFKRADT